MTGSVLFARPDTGTWTVIHDSEVDGATWGAVTWNGLTPGDRALTVTAASSADGIDFGPAETVVSGADLTVADGRYLKVSVTFARASTGESPVLYDLPILANRLPDCSLAAPSLATLWPPNHRFHSISVLGVTDPDGDPVTITITGIWQDEPVNTLGDGRFTPDGGGVATSTAEVRAERAASARAAGNGRVYHIWFTATDPYGYACSGEVRVSVPHDDETPAVDDGPLYDSTVVVP